MSYATLLFEISSAAAQTFVGVFPEQGLRQPPPCGIWCEYTHNRSLLPVLLAALGSILSCVLIALRLIWLLIHRTSGRHLLDAVWKAFGVGTLTILAQSLVKWGWAGRLSSADAGLTLLLYVVLIAVSMLGFSPRLRLRLTGWIAMRGAASSSASQMAQLMGANSVTDDVMRTSQKLLRCVAFNALRPSDFEGSVFPEDARARTRPAQIGEIDAFLSHS